MIRCTALTRIVHGDGHWKMARAHVNLAAAYLDHKSKSTLWIYWELHGYLEIVHKHSREP